MPTESSTGKEMIPPPPAMESTNPARKPPPQRKMPVNRDNESRPASKSIEFSDIGRYQQISVNRRCQ
jgi:hypothetical protein